MSLGPPVPSFGPTPNRIALVGEAPGSEETERLRPFVGPSGQELRRMLRTIGVSLDDCWRTNVFDQQPPSNDIASAYGVPRDDPRADSTLGPMTANPTSFLSTDHLPHLDRLYRELVACRPNIIVALGNTACWALGLGLGINALRGAVQQVELCGNYVKVLPTYHPAAILRQWDQRVIAIADLEKAHVESSTPDLNFDNSELWLQPTLADLHEFGDRYLENATHTAVDVETKQGQITCLSFAPSVDRAIVVPFWKAGPDPHYWPTVEEERCAWKWSRKWVERPTLVKITQNGMYDASYFRSPHGMRPTNFSEDTMIAHHSLYGELRKGLGLLGSLYANVPEWKSMRAFKKEEWLKRDD
jgi:DNA polymerase